MSSPAPAPAPTVKSKMVAPVTIPPKEPKSTPSKDSKLHRRSRSGCYTCRLRRKKCDEGQPACKACKHLGLKCEFKRPVWWSSGEQRRQIKDNIKNLIKDSQLQKKSTHINMAVFGTSSPPSLYHSATEGFSDSMDQSRAASVDSPFLTDPFTHISQDGYFALPPRHGLPPTRHPAFSPYEIDIKTESQVFVNDMPTRKDSSISTFSTFQTPPNSSGQPAFPLGSWVEQDYFESQQETFAEEPVNFEFFDFPNGDATPTRETVIVVDEVDRPLLDHFLKKVMRLIFPVLDSSQHGSAGLNAILPALESNRCYLHCCLSIAGIHKKSTESLSDAQGEQMDNDIMRHRYATVSELCEALHQDENHSQILEATLAMIFFQCCVGRPDDSLPDIAWHQHFQAATSLIHKLDLLSLSGTTGQPHPAFNMTLTSWIDILGATMIGRSPAFADTYRETNIANGSLGLGELMGCDDQIMFLISEIACLEARKLEGMEEVMLCKYIEILGTEIGVSEPPPGAVVSAFSATGVVRPRQLRINMTAVFRLAARIYLCSMVPGFTISSPSIINLVSAFTDAMGFIPGGPEGFDRSLVWPLMIAGSVSLMTSAFRLMFSERCARLGDSAELGSFGRTRGLLKEIWQLNDSMAAMTDFQSVHWRDVMQQKSWDFLLI